MASDIKDSMYIFFFKFLIVLFKVIWEGRSRDHRSGGGEITKNLAGDYFVSPRGVMEQGCYKMGMNVIQQTQTIVEENSAKGPLRSSAPQWAYRPLLSFL